MDKHQQHEDPVLGRFEDWLQKDQIQPAPGMLMRVRSRLNKTPSSIDAAIDDLFRQDPSLGNPHLPWRIRQQLASEHRNRQWSRWLAPVAAAATLTLALLSFQIEGPRPGLESASASVPAVTPADSLDLNADVTQLLALASALDGTTDVSKLESVENLAFLFN